MNSSKVLLIGVDGAPFDLLMKWTREGHLPHIASLLDESAYGVLESTLDVTPPAWSSIYTGKNAGKHGVFDFMYHEPGTYKFAPINASKRDSRDVWEILSSNGSKVGVLNAPLSFPVRPVNGFLVAGFLTPGEQVDYTYPSSLKNELKEVVPGYKPSASNELQLNLNKDSYVRNIMNQLENLRRAATYLIKKEELDFFGVFISETDHVQHWFWKDMENPKGSAGDKYSSVILDTYKATDRIVGDLIKAVDENTFVILVSDHGGAYLNEFFHTNYFLRSIGMLNFKRTFRVAFRRFLFDHGITPKLHRLLVRKNSFLLHYLSKPLAMSIADLDWQKTSAYSLGYGQIYLNVKNREKSGSLPPEKIEETTSFITKKLSEVTDPNGATHPIQSIHTKAEMYRGAHADGAPDIQLVMSEGYEAFSWASIADRLFTKSIDRTGTHNTRGVVAVKGSGIVKGTITGASVFDIAPTILQIMGMEIPLDIDGRVLTQMFTPEHFDAHPIRYVHAEGHENRGQYELTLQEQEKIEESLRSLGYI